MSSFKNSSKANLTRILSRETNSSKLKQFENTDRLKQLAMPNIHYVLSVLKENTSSLDKHMRLRLEEIVSTIRKNKPIDFDKLETALAYCKELGAGDMTNENDEKCHRPKPLGKSRFKSEPTSKIKVDDIKSHASTPIKTTRKFSIETETESLDRITKSANTDQEEISIVKEHVDNLSSATEEMIKKDPIHALLNLDEKLMTNSPDCIFQRDIEDVLPKTSSAEMEKLEVLFDGSQSLVDETSKESCNTSAQTPDSINTLDYAISSEQELIARKRKMPKSITALTVKYYIILLHDMGRNLNLYRLFSAKVMLPVLRSHEVELQRAYNCWKDYLNYADATVRTLQPYMVDIMAQYPRNEQEEQKQGVIGKEMPTVLADALQKMRKWRNVLENTVLCVAAITMQKRLLRDPKHKYRLTSHIPCAHSKQKNAGRKLKGSRIIL